MAEYLSKPYPIQQGPDAAAIDYNFDTLWRIIRSLQDQITDLTGVSPTHKILSTTHSDSVVDTPVDGDMLMFNTLAGGWERLPIGLTDQFLKVTAGAPVWTSFTITYLPAHNLLSAKHADTTVGSPVRGDVIVAQADTTGGIDSSKYWLDGFRLPATSSEEDPGTQKYWIDGARMPELVSAQTTGLTTWRRKSRGSTGQVLGLALNGLDTDWVTPAASSVGLGAKAYSTVPQSLSFNGPTAIVFSSTEFDGASFFNGATPTRLTVPTAGVYVIVGQVSTDVYLGPRLSRLLVNGIMRAQQEVGELGSDATVYYDSVSNQVSAILSLAAGDYIELQMNQLKTTRAAVNTVVTTAGFTFLSALKVG